MEVSNFMPYTYYTRMTGPGARNAGFMLIAPIYKNTRRKYYG